MTKLEKYNKIFIELFEIEEERIKTLVYQGTPEWDSIGHMTLISEIEDNFNIMMDTDDIIEFSSYDKGKEILIKYGIEI